MENEDSFQQQFGNYWLLERIARGGMAEIFRALVMGTGEFTKIVVIKRMLPHLSADLEYVDRFIAEAKITSQLAHTNIVNLNDFGLVDDKLYHCLEYVQGTTVGDLVQAFVAQGRPPPIPEVCTLIIEALYGLDQAHRLTDSNGKPLNIVHRDLTPSNLLISWEGYLKIADFGIVQASKFHHHTQRGTVQGKFRYLSPEQALGKDLDQRSDLFNLGACFYELLTRTTLYPEEPMLKGLARIQSADFVPPRKRNPAIPRALEAILLKALEKNPEQRYQSAEAMRDELEGLMFDVGLRASNADVAKLLLEMFADQIKAEQQKIADEIAAARPDRSENQEPQATAVKTFILKQSDMPPGVVLFPEEESTEKKPTVEIEQAPPGSPHQADDGDDEPALVSALPPDRSRTPTGTDSGPVQIPDLSATEEDEAESDEPALVNSPLPSQATELPTSRPGPVETAPPKPAVRVPTTEDLPAVIIDPSLLDPSTVSDEAEEVTIDRPPPTAIDAGQIATDEIPVAKAVPPLPDSMQAETVEFPAAAPSEEFASEDTDKFATVGPPSPGKDRIVITGKPPKDTASPDTDKFATVGTPSPGKDRILITGKPPTDTDKLVPVDTAPPDTDKFATVGTPSPGKDRIVITGKPPTDTDKLVPVDTAPPDTDKFATTGRPPRESDKIATANDASPDTDKIPIGKIEAEASSRESRETVQLPSIQTTPPDGVVIDSGSVEIAASPPDQNSPPTKSKQAEIPNPAARTVLDGRPLGSRPTVVDLDPVSPEDSEPAPWPPDPKDPPPLEIPPARPVEPKRVTSPETKKAQPPPLKPPDTPVRQDPSPPEVPPATKRVTSPEAKKAQPPPLKPPDTPMSKEPERQAQKAIETPVSKKPGPPTRKKLNALAEKVQPPNPQGDNKPTLIRGQPIPEDRPEPEDPDDPDLDDDDFDADFDDDPELDDPDDLEDLADVPDEEIEEDPDEDPDKKKKKEDPDKEPGDETPEG